MEFLPIMKNGERVYAGLWKRLLAAFLDAVVMVPVSMAAGWAEGGSLGAAYATMVAFGLFFVAYTVFFHARYGATLGKMIVGIKVARPDGSCIGLKEALLHSSVGLGFALAWIAVHVGALAQVDSGLYLATEWSERILLLHPFLPDWYGMVEMAAIAWYLSEFVVLIFNRRRRAPHDFIAGTVVVRWKFAAERG